eukprot:CAMPEP_0177555724 /NCGR_PEP_ID=MMETSP0369-20130122/68698_1 /TAXON_ID=447022 ORGANISM="Scrippsiella hangoei-like, Strain SHHI-4" /NCGR_SAMPLE_ID=MMETSP0369 /ASSEMBLY_ACC=CAM_ASM_000364 /LENGTH=41 /DNA_ID= /DNA_START= /DNA_END= /DNA_ORIENTATION=
MALIPEAGCHRLPSGQPAHVAHIMPFDLDVGRIEIQWSNVT